MVQNPYFLSPVPPISYSYTPVTAPPLPGTQGLKVYIYYFFFFFGFRRDLSNTGSHLSLYVCVCVCICHKNIMNNIQNKKYQKKNLHRIFIYKQT